MKKETARALMIIVGVVILLIVLGLGSAVWLFTSSVDQSSADAATAEHHFDEIRQRFEGVSPVLEMQNEEPVVTRQPPGATTGTRLSSLRVIVWDDRDNKLTRVDLPFWLLRMKRGPIAFANRDAKFGESRLNLTVEQLEKYGPTLVLDHIGRRGEHVLIWTE